MKKVILFTFLFAFVSAVRAQLVPDNYVPAPEYNLQTFYEFENDTLKISTDTVWVRGDTLDLGENPQSIKYIRLGGCVYKIVSHSPTLEKVDGFGLIFNGTGIMYHRKNPARVTHK